MEQTRNQILTLPSPTGVTAASNNSTQNEDHKAHLIGS